MRQIYIILTDNCNLLCSHCIRNKKNNKGNMNFNDAIKCIDVFSKFWGDATCVLSGGEPTLHKDFNRILKYSTQKFKSVSINSNGTSEFWRQEDYIQYDSTVRFQISIDGTETVHDSIRGLGTFNKAIKTIMRLQENKKRTIISTTVSNKNKDTILQLSDYLMEIGVKEWSIQKEMPFGEATASSENDFSIDEWNKLCTEIINHVDDKIMIYTRKLFDFLLLSKLSDDEIRLYSRKAITNCGTAKYKLYVHPDLSVYGCTCLENIPLGNLKSMSIEQIVSSDSYKRLSECKLAKNSPCITCRFLLICNGGCPGISIKYFGDIGYGDVRCPIVKKYYKGNYE